MIKNRVIHFAARLGGLGIVCAALLSSGACVRDFRPQTPMPIINYPFATQGHRAPALIVFLPGRRDRASVFQLNGFIDLVRKHGLDADIIATDAHIGYYISGSFVRQLHEEIVVRAHRDGYRHIILIGVSMGAYGAIRYAVAHPSSVETIVLLSPFLGAGPVSRDIAEAGDEDFEQSRSWLKQYPTSAGPEARSAAKYPHLVLGYGEEDLFPIKYAEVRAVLPPADVFTAPGGHLWRTWRALLEKILDANRIDVPVVKP